MTIKTIKVFYLRENIKSIEVYNVIKKEKTINFGILIHCIGGVIHKNYYLYPTESARDLIYEKIKESLHNCHCIEITAEGELI
jgi:hypothetical protein